MMQLLRFLTITLLDYHGIAVFSQHINSWSIAYFDMHIFQLNLDCKITGKYGTVVRTICLLPSQA